MEKDLTAINKHHQRSDEEFGRWSPIPQREGVCSYVRHGRKAGRQEERLALDPMGKGQERSIPPEPGGGQLKAHCLAAPDAHGTASASVLGHRLS